MSMAIKESTPPASSKPATVRQRVHIQVKYTGKGQPGEQLRERCDTLEKMLAEQDAGTVAGRDAGEGAVNIYVATRFPDHTKEKARQIVNELGIAARTTMKLVDGKSDGKSEG